MRRRLIVTAKVYDNGAESLYKDIPPHYIDLDWHLLESLFSPTSFFDYWTPIPESIEELSGFPIYESYRVLREIRRRVHRRSRKLLTYYSSEDLSEIYMLVNTIGVLHIDFPGVNLYFQTTLCNRTPQLGIRVCSEGCLLSSPVSV